MDMTNILWKAEQAYEHMEESNSSEIVNAIGAHISKNEDLLIEATENDEINKVSIISIENEIDKVAKQSSLYKKIIENFKTEEGFILGSHYVPLGVLGALYDGNPFTAVCLIARAIASHNSIILCTDKNITTNGVIVELARKVLKINDYPEDLIQIVFEREGIISSDLRIRNIIAVGNREEQDEITEVAKVNVITSGYNNYEIYIEDQVDKELISRIISSTANIKIFINQDMEEEYEGIECVDDMEHAIAEINRRGSGFSASIITRDRNNALQFMKRVKSRSVSVNASPMIHGAFDIELEELMKKQTLFYPEKGRLE